MIEPVSIVPRRACHASRGIPRVTSERQLCRVKNMLEIIHTYEKAYPGFGSITQVMALYQAMNS